MAACQQFATNVTDLEDLIRDDDRFEQLNTNYDIYKQIVLDIFDWAIKNRNTVTYLPISLIRASLIPLFLPIFFTTVFMINLRHNRIDNTINVFINSIL